MPSQKNLDHLQELNDKINSAQMIILADHTGISVADQTELRQKTAETKAEFTVTKNTLLKQALTKRLKTLPDSLETALSGPTALLIAKEDPAASAKALAHFISHHQLPTIKIGLILASTSGGFTSPQGGLSSTPEEDKILSPEEITVLSSLPNKETLLATLLCQLNAPAQKLTAVLSAPIQNLVYVLNTLTKKGGEPN